MRVVADYRGEEIVLKKYTSYLALDKDLSSFEDKEDLMKKMGFDSRVDDIIILDNNGNPMDYDFKTVRKTLSFYEKGKEALIKEMGLDSILGEISLDYDYDPSEELLNLSKEERKLLSSRLKELNYKNGREFMKWIFDLACNNYHNKDRLITFFTDKLLDFTKNDPNFTVDSIKNHEGKRLYGLTKHIKDQLIMFGNTTSTLEMGKASILPHLESYLSKGAWFNYGYMRKFACSLGERKYNFGEDKIDNLNEKKQEKVVYDFKTAIHNFGYPKRQIRLDEMTKEDIIPITVYDENGIKNDEEPFLEEFNEQEKTKKMLKK